MTDFIFMLNPFPQVSRMQVTVHKPHAPKPHAPIAAPRADVGVTIVPGRLKVEKLRTAKGEVGEFAASFPLRIGRLLTAAR